jgi:hypothetical protein
VDRSQAKTASGRAVAPLATAGDIWWASVGQNVGSEINGKSRLFSRPVIIFKKLAHGFYFVIPTTTKPKGLQYYFGNLMRLTSSANRGSERSPNQRGSSRSQTSQCDLSSNALLSHAMAGSF